MPMKKKFFSPVLFCLIVGATLFGGGRAAGSAGNATWEHVADSILGFSNDTIFKDNGDTVVKHYYMTRMRKNGDTVIKKNNFFRKFYTYFRTANEDKTQEKDFDFSIIGGPHYSSTVKLGLGIVAAGLYRVDKNDLSIPPSNVSFFGDVTTTGFYLLGVRGNTLFTGGKYRLDFNTYFFSFPSAFWGIGYDSATYGKAGAYKRLQNQVKVDFMVRVAKDIEQLRGENPLNINAGLGVFLMYDSRDFITNAYRGIYFKAEQRFFPSFMGNRETFYRTEVQWNAYHPLWKGAVMAYDVHGMFNYGNPPWTMLALMGGSSRMRGYYEGRYRDNNLIEAQVELRQKVYGRNGIVIWGGAGNVFPSFSKFNGAHTLPNYGIGYRWEFKKRVNVRLDYGFGLRGQKSFMFGINEAF